MQKSLIRDYKLLNRFCQRRNKDYNCKKIFGCDVVCPLWQLQEVQRLMDEKNLSLGEAYKITDRYGIDKKTGLKIIAEKVREHMKDEEENR